MLNSGWMRMDDDDDDQLSYFEIGDEIEFVPREEAGRRWWSFATFPLFVNALVFLIEITMVAFLARRFSESYKARPLLTTMVTNAMLAGIADTVAQTLSIVRNRQQFCPEPDYGLGPERIPKTGPNSLTPFDLIVPASPAHPHLHLPASVPAEERFDFGRLARFGAYGFLMAPLQFKWFGLLSRTFPLGPGLAGSAAALKRVVFDQAVFAPVGLGLFYSFMTLSEGRSVGVLKEKLREVYLPTLKANYLLWPAVQLINFRLMPLPLQLPFVSTVGIFWTAYLSLKNASVEEKLED